MAAVGNRLRSVPINGMGHRIADRMAETLNQF
jgi:hypothetical protein